MIKDWIVYPLLSNGNYECCFKEARDTSCRAPVIDSGCATSKQEADQTMLPANPSQCTGKSTQPGIGFSCRRHTNYTFSPHRAGNKRGPANKGRLQYDFENYHFQYDVGTIIDMQYTIRTAVNADQKQTMALLPSLADFNVPPHRNPDHLWQGDARLLEKYFNHETPDTHALVAVDAHSKVQGIAIYTMRDEFLSGEPAAHLEVLAVSSESRKQGIGRALIDATESAARHLGAKSLTLHVFSNNTRARKLYASAGFDEELLRCYKEI